ncbi:hypothetical protein [Arthrobacter sp. YN]|uniref:hypothetical protein n=1 Tax=Arthrobacter sp. YN TaxID=2020486 RepID=UPI000B61CA96|nr:hypothetical protein [Arthrobacter sp. YN]ASN20683.1 hypothetical protein CGK93_14090 [Arthrobacter sp. YN]
MSPQRVQRKPLELHVYPKQFTRTGQEVYDLGRPTTSWGETLTPTWVVDMEARNKHLTGPELAAEHWLFCWLWENSIAGDDGYDGHPVTREYRRRADVMERFATHPHYDEADQ